MLEAWLSRGLQQQVQEAQEQGRVCGLRFYSPPHPGLQVRLPVSARFHQMRHETYAALCAPRGEEPNSLVSASLSSFFGRGAAAKYIFDLHACRVDRTGDVPTVYATGLIFGFCFSTGYISFSQFLFPCVLLFYFFPHDVLPFLSCT